MIPFRDSNPSGTPPVVTVGIILANLAAFAYELSLGPLLEPFISHYGVIPALVTGAEGYVADSPTDLVRRFLGAMFLHGGWLHLVSNMWYLWLFGDNIEDRLGHLGFLGFYMGCGVAATSFHVAMDPVSPVPMIGASGAIAGVLGAYLVCFPRARIATFLPVLFMPFVFEFPASLVLGSWFLIQLFSGTAAAAVPADAGGGVAWWAHVGGFVVGMVSIRLLPCRSCRRQRVYAVRFDRA
ncbi:MAG TPA: rhomboid family intramembrane serine protease [Candidatus Latescibacteria bacterium]|nr:rhomboid family intramembrane serine protease [Candidatus Latescibacterota bacterium]